MKINTNLPIDYLEYCITAEFSCAIFKDSHFNEEKEMAINGLNNYLKTKDNPEKIPFFKDIFDNYLSNERKSFIAGRAMHWVNLFRENYSEEFDLTVNMVPPKN